MKNLVSYHPRQPGCREVRGREGPWVGEGGREGKDGERDRKGEENVAIKYVGHTKQQPSVEGTRYLYWSSPTFKEVVRRGGRRQRSAEETEKGSGKGRGRVSVDGGRNWGGPPRQGRVVMVWRRGVVLPFQDLTDVGTLMKIGQRPGKVTLADFKGQLNHHKVCWPHKTAAKCRRYKVLVLVKPYRQGSGQEGREEATECGGDGEGEWKGEGEGVSWWGKKLGRSTEAGSSSLGLVKGSCTAFPGSDGCWYPHEDWAEAR